jgi:hypothetical protein
LQYLISSVLNAVLGYLTNEHSVPTTVPCVSDGITLTKKCFSFTSQMFVAVIERLAQLCSIRDQPSLISVLATYFHKMNFSIIFHIHLRNGVLPIQNRAYIS